MDVWTIGEKLKLGKEDHRFLEKRVTHIEDHLEGLNNKLDLINNKMDLINKANNETVQDKKSKSSRVRTKRSTSKKS